MFDAIALLSGTGSTGSTGNPFQAILAPVINLLNMVLGPAIALVGALGTVYCVILGVKLAKAEEQADREKAKNSLKNAIIGFILIFVLVVVLRVALVPMQTWMENASTASAAS